MRGQNTSLPANSYPKERESKKKWFNVGITTSLLGQIYVITVSSLWNSMRPFAEFLKILLSSLKRAKWTWHLKNIHTIEKERSFPSLIFSGGSIFNLPGCNLVGFTGSCEANSADGLPVADPDYGSSNPFLVRFLKIEERCKGRWEDQNIENWWQKKTYAPRNDSQRPSLLKEYCSYFLEMSGLSPIIAPSGYITNFHGQWEKMGKNWPSDLQMLFFLSLDVRTSHWHVGLPLIAMYVLPEKASKASRRINMDYWCGWQLLVFLNHLFC